MAINDNQRESIREIDRANAMEASSTRISSESGCIKYRGEVAQPAHLGATLE